MPLTNIPDVTHPHTNFTLAEAIRIAVDHATTFDRKVPESLEEVRRYIQEMARHTGHHWITGYAALDVLDAAIDGKDLSAHSRLI